MILGIDTSNYTTSAALLDGKKFISRRILLPVREGTRGLRQRDAVFHHVKQLPVILEELPFSSCSINAVSVSTTPRNVKGSYMPAFLPGESTARAIAAALNVPLYRFSHQEGHIAAGIYSSSAFALLKKPFISVHLSGGTTEILKSEYKNGRIQTEIIGKTLDISAGQLIDRVGVDLGLCFPCGKEADSLSRLSVSPVKLPVSVKGGDINFSGAETKCKAFYSRCDKADILNGVFVCIADSLIKALKSCIAEYNINDILFVGGVASNSLIRSRLSEMLHANIIYASAELSTDNAVGTAYLGYLNHGSLSDMQ